MTLRRPGILLLVALLGPLLVLAAPAPVLADEIAELAEAADAAPGGTIPILVHLDAPARPEGTLSTTQANRQRERIADTASDALDDVEEGEVAGVEVFETIPFVSMTADAAAIEDLAASGSVRSVVLDGVMRPMLAESVPVVQGDVTAGLGYDGTGYNVAIVDTGVDLDHEFLAGKIHTNQACFAKGDDNGAPGGVCPNGQESQTGIGSGAGAACTFTPFGKDCDHGTHVAGIAAGVGVGGDTSHGVADGAGIVAVQVFSDDEDNGDKAGAFFSDILLGLEWLDDNKATLSLAAVNMSLGDGTEHATTCDNASANAIAFKTVIASLRASGIATVVSAGNSDHDAGLSFPACLSNVISVGSVNVDGDEVSSFSNEASYLSLYAPGEIVRSSVPDVNVPSNSYEPFNGTSMAAPHVAGAWAVMRQVRAAAGFAPDVTAELAAMRATGFDIGGFPRLALYQALLPTAPTDVVVLPGDGNATVSWTAPTWTGAGPITGYQVNAWPTAAPNDVTSTAVGADVTSLLVPNLTVPGDHTFSVQALNSIADPGLESASVNVATAPGAPTNVAASRGSGRATVTWTAPGNGGSPITDYRVTVSPADGVASPTLSVGAAITSLAFTGLTNGQTYTFTVTAVNAVGESVASAASNAVTPKSSSGGGGGGGGSGTTTTTTTRPPTTTTTTTAPPPPEPDPIASPGASVGNGDVVTIIDGELVVIPSFAPAGVVVVAGAATPSGNGAWAVTAAGQVFKTGDAGGFGDLTGKRLNAPIVGIAPTPTGKGYWLLGRDGGIFSFGDAAFFGSTGNMVLNQPVVGMASTTSGRGYWLFAGDGGIFTFGDARFFGSTGALRLNAPVTTMAPTPTGRGYWLLGSDGGVFTFGDAAFHGSTGGRADVGAIRAIIPTPTGRGYWLIGDDGRLHRFGNAT